MNFGVLEQAIHHAAKEKLGTAKSSRSPPKPTQALDSGLWTLDPGPDSPTDQSRATRARAERRSDMTDRQTDSRQTQMIFMPLDRDTDRQLFLLSEFWPAQRPSGPRRTGTAKGPTWTDKGPESPATNNCMPESQFGHRMLENSTFTAVSSTIATIFYRFDPKSTFAQPKAYTSPFAGFA